MTLPGEEIPPFAGNLIGVDGIETHPHTVQPGSGDFMKMYRCTKCGYIYNPNTGDAKQNIASQTPFDQLPDSWRCPRCRVTKDRFVEVEV